MSREERVAESKEEKLGEEGRVFLVMTGVGQSSAEWPFLYLFIVDVQ